MDSRYTLQDLIADLTDEQKRVLLEFILDMIHNRPAKDG